MTLPAFCSGTLTARILAFAAGLFLVIPTASQIHAFLAQKELAEEIERIIVKVQGRAQEAVGTIQSAERSTRKADVLRHLDQLARLIPVAYDVPPALCEQYAYHANRLKLAGTPIGCNDLWIACHALAKDMVLVTNNMNEFARIEGLNLENWADGA